jgi:hypothetical protein
MMSRSLDELDAVLNSACQINDSVHINDAVPPTLLRQRRTALTPTWSRVSFAVEVLALDLEVLDRRTQSDEDHLQAIIDDLPDLLTDRWHDDASLLAIDTPALIAAAADTDGLLDLHQEMAGSDLDDPEVARSLLVRMNGQRSALIERKDRLEKEIDQIQETLLRHYATGTASTDDWLD